MRFLIGLFVIVNIIFATIPLMAEDVLNVSVLNWDSTPAGGLQFPGAEDATTGEPWIISPQYIRVIYSCDNEIWGIRIVTDNQLNIGGVELRILGIGPGPDGIPGTLDDTWEAGPDGIFGTDDDIWGYGPDGIPGTDDDTVNVSFGGLIDPATKDSPRFRASLAWQVYNNPGPDVPDEIFKNWEKVWNVGGNWNDDWAYVVDKSDMLNGEPAVGGVYYPDSWNAKYEMVIVGDPDISYLATHPYTGDSRLGDGDIAVYIAACFGIPSDTEPDEFVGTLPRGTYGTTIYLELIHE